MHNCALQNPKKIAAEPVFGSLSTVPKEKVWSTPRTRQPLQSVTLSTPLPRLPGVSAIPSSALAAFLRGIEPRARVLVRAQAGPSLDDEALLVGVREEFAARAKALLEPLAAYYFLEARTPGNRPVDPVARFHLGNGARLERID